MRGLNKNIMKNILTVLVLIVVLVITSCTKTNETTDPIEEKVNSLLAQMTLEEKLGQLVQSNYKGEVSEWEKIISKGQIGSFLNLPSDAKTVNEIQKIAVEKSRLEISLKIPH